MPEPHEFRVLQALQSAIRGISTTAGYYYSIEGLAVKLDPDQGVDDLVAEQGPRPFVILDVRPELWDYNFGANQVQLLMPVWVHWVHEPTRDVDQQLMEPAARDDDFRMQTYWRGCADIERALGGSAGLAGTVSSARITRRRMHDEDTRIWAVVETELRLHRTFGEPVGV